MSRGRNRRIMSDEDVISAFRQLDTEGKGKISEDDMRRYMTTMGDKMSDREFDMFMKDAGGGSSVNYEKFVKAFNAQAQG